MESPPICDPIISRCWETEHQPVEVGSQILDVQGRLKKSLDFWINTLNAPVTITGWIKEGYKLPLVSLPPVFTQPNHMSALSDNQFVNQSLDELLAHRCIQKVPNIPHICSPLSVVTNTEGKKRLVINLRYLNQYLWKDHFKYEDLRTVIQMFSQDDYMFVFDLKSGYHHVDICPLHWQYLGFSWESGQGTNYYVFKVLPFGLSTACYVFTKLMHPLIRYWHSSGIRAVVYLDDGIVVVKGEEEAKRVSQQVQDDLVNAGLIVNVLKSNWTPSKLVTWLGFNIDLGLACLSVPASKITVPRNQLEWAVGQSCMPVKIMASIVGKIISMSLALGPIARFMTMALYANINARHSWCQIIPVSPEALVELKFWLVNIEGINGQNIWYSPAAVRLVYSDASNTGYTVKKGVSF